MNEAQDETSAATRLRETEKALRTAGRELKWWQTQFEHTAEALQRVRRQRSRLRQQSASLADALAREFSAAYWREQQAGRGRWQRPPGPEAQLVRELDASPLFDGGWYLRQHQDEIIELHVTPALHHIRNANQRRLDPSEAFSTGRYLLHHPEARGAGLPALLHAQRNGFLDSGLVGEHPGDPEATDV